MKYQNLLILLLSTFVIHGSLKAAEKQDRLDIWRGISFDSPLLNEIIKASDRAPASFPTATKGVLSPGCDYPPKPPIFSTTNKEITSSTVDLKAPAYYMKDLLAVLMLTQVGRPIAQRFLPAFEAGEVQVLLASHDELAVRFKGDSAIAFCEISNGKRKIYIDKTAETGAVAPVLLHELVHCLDSENIQAASNMGNLLQSFSKSASLLLNAAVKRSGKGAAELALVDILPAEMTVFRGLKDEISQFAHLASFRTERKAYTAGHTTVQELLQKFPQYYQTGKGDLGSRSDEQIVEDYHLNASWIEAYKKGYCRTQ